MFAMDEVVLSKKSRRSRKNYVTLWQPEVPGPQHKFIVSKEVGKMRVWAGQVPA
jgi:hypothetical protein